MPTIGDVWKVQLGDSVRTVKVIAASESPDWFRCIDEETGVSILASDRRILPNEAPMSSRSSVAMTDFVT